MTAESRTLAPESPIRPMYFEARITRISYTLGRSCDPLGIAEANTLCETIGSALRLIRQSANNALINSQENTLGKLIGVG